MIVAGVVLYVFENYVPWTKRKFIKLQSFVLCKDSNCKDIFVVNRDLPYKVGRKPQELPCGHEAGFYIVPGDNFKAILYNISNKAEK
jgi:hypothetical protein